MSNKYPLPLGVIRLICVVSVAWLLYYNYKSLQMTGNKIYLSQVDKVRFKVDSDAYADFLDTARNYYPNDANLGNRALIKKYAAPGKAMRQTFPHTGRIHDRYVAEGWVGWTLKASRFEYWAWMFGPIILLFFSVVGIAWVIDGFGRTSVEPLKDK
jgi:hypothetical protein